jgi:hypothetical protein
VSLKSIGAKALAHLESNRIRRWASDPISAQAKTFRLLLQNLQSTAFGRDHFVENVSSHDGWKSKVPICDYEGLKPYVERVLSGEKDVLWPGKPAYFCKTSGTTSGTKYIPMSDHGIKAQIKAARSALLLYIKETGNSSFLDGKMIFLQGSPIMDSKNGIQVGRLSGIVAHHVPSYLQRNRMPTWDVNCMEDWSEKVDAIVDETIRSDMRLISGIPPWVQMYYERLLAESGKKSIIEVFPNLSVFAHGGVNYAPYKATMDKLVGRAIDSIETYPASEGFIAFQDSQKEEGLLLNLDAGIYYEFIPVDEVGLENPSRLSLGDVRVGVNYAIVLNTSSGLWGYLIGDTVKFVSISPYRIIVTGRIAQFISAFGEHVIAEEAERAISEVCGHFAFDISEFHMAPQVSPEVGLPFHEWFIECEAALPTGFEKALDSVMRKSNGYYNDLIEGDVLRPLVITRLKRGVFNQYMQSIGKLGGQNKLPRLSNDRAIADQLKDYL